MKRKLPQKLGPKAAKAWLDGTTGGRVGVLIWTAPSSATDDVCRAVESLGGLVEARLTETNLLSVAVDASMLDSVAAIDGVTYVELGERFSG